MIKQEHKGFKMKEGEGFFIVNTISKQALFQELDEYCKEHPDQSIYVSLWPVVPQKGIHIPEYAMEVLIDPAYSFLNLYQLFQQGKDV